MDTPTLSPRQEAIIRAAATGMGQKEIAKHLGMAPATAGTHLRYIYARLGIVSKNGEKVGSKLTAWAIQHGYGPQPDIQPTTEVLRFHDVAAIAADLGQGPERRKL